MGYQLVQNIFMQLEANFRFVLVITHVEELKDQLSQIISLKKKW